MAAVRLQVALELLDSAEMFLTDRTARLNNFVLIAQKRRQIMSVNFVLDCAE